MSKPEPTVWGIHAGRSGEAETLFLKRKVIALGWAKAGDLSGLETRDDFKAQVAEAYPETTPAALPNRAGQIYRFVHEAKVGDLVVYPSNHTREVHIGRVTGPYQYDPKPEPNYPQHRAVEWLRSEPRASFTQGALYEIGSAMSFFQVSKHVDEFVAALEGRSAPVLAAEDETGPDADEIEEYTRDFVLKQLAQELKGHPFADLVAHLLQKMGYRTRVSPPGPDRGIDIVAHRDELGFEPPIVKVQVKSTEGTVGDPEVSALYGRSRARSTACS